MLEEEKGLLNEVVEIGVRLISPSPEACVCPKPIVIVSAGGWTARRRHRGDAAAVTPVCRSGAKEYWALIVNSDGKPQSRPPEKHTLRH